MFFIPKKLTEVIGERVSCAIFPLENYKYLVSLINSRKVKDTTSFWTTFFLEKMIKKNEIIVPEMFISSIIINKML